MSDLHGTPSRPEDATWTPPPPVVNSPVDPPVDPPYDVAFETETGRQETSTTDVAKDEAANVKDTALAAGQNVAGTAKDEAANVVRETKQQARGLLDTVGGELRDQAGSQQQRIASTVHALSKELGGMASSSQESGPLTDLAQEASRRGGEIAHWLENREPKDVLEEVKSFGRRRPVAFLGICVVAGIVVGRLTRGAIAANTSLDSPGDDGDRSAPALTSQPVGSPSYVAAPSLATAPAVEGYAASHDYVTTGTTAGPSTGPTSTGTTSTGTTGFPDPVTTWTDQPANAPLADPLARPDDTR